MIFRTDSKRVEVEYSRGFIFFVRLPLVGEVLWTRTNGWQYWSSREANAKQLQQPVGESHLIARLEPRKL
jgi:hypothetical protein